MIGEIGAHAWLRRIGDDGFAARDEACARLTRGTLRTAVSIDEHRYSRATPVLRLVPPQRECHHRPMRRLILSLLACVPIAGCVTSHFEDVVRVAASEHPRACTAPYTVKKLNGWAYRVDACEGTLYYSCAFKPNTAVTECCYPVPDEAAATAAVRLTGQVSTCLDFAN